MDLNLREIQRTFTQEEIITTLQLPLDVDEQLVDMHVVVVDKSYNAIVDITCTTESPRGANVDAFSIIKKDYIKRFETYAFEQLLNFSLYPDETLIKAKIKKRNGYFLITATSKKEEV